MNAPLKNPPSSAPANKSLWAAVAVLGIAVVALGAALIRIQANPVEPRLAALSATSAAPTALLADDKISESNKALEPVIRPKPAIKSAANKNEKAAGAYASGHDSVAPVRAPICSNCGTIESVTPMERDGTAGGGGAIAGGVLGAVVGNQIGAGNGKTLATLLGAVGGGFAGNTVEKKMKKTTVYQVRVRMEDGSSQTVEQATSATVGAQVIVDGNSLRAANR